MAIGISKREKMKSLIKIHKFVYNVFKKIFRRSPFIQGNIQPQHPYSENYPYKWCSHIDITSYCPNNNCIYCSRFLRHMQVASEIQS
jgi:hypothetical protein